MSDSFPVFAAKIHKAVAGKPATHVLEYLQTQNVRFNGQLANRTMMQAVNFMTEKYSQEACKVLVGIERVHGRDALTSSYWKLLRLGQICSKEAEASKASKPTQALITFVLQAIGFQLKYEMVSPKALTVEWLDKARDGAAGAVLLALSKNQLIEHVCGLIKDLEAVDPKLAVVQEMHAVLDKFTDYEVYERLFKKPDEALAATQGAEPNAAATADDDDPVRKASVGLSKAPAAMLTFLFDVFGGEYDSNLKDMIGKKKSVVALCFAEAPDDEFGQALREATRLLAMHKQVIGIESSSAPPNAASRTLHRYNSEAEGDEDRRNELRKEREDAWKQAQASRKKFVTFGFCRYAKPADIQTFFEKQTSVYNYSGKVGEAHRLFVLSADLFTECQEQPWAATPTWSETASKALPQSLVAVTCVSRLLRLHSPCLNAGRPPLVSLTLLSLSSDCN